MRTIARLLIVTLMTSVFLGALIAHEGELFKKVVTSDTGVLYAATVDAELNAGDCWAGGEGNGYPTRMWVTKSDAFGAYYAEVTSQRAVDRMIERVVAGESTNLRAFCDGVAL